MREFKAYPRAFCESRLFPENKEMRK